MTNIFVNGEEIDINTDQLTYEQVAEIAGRVEPSVTFSNSPVGGQDGSLRKGESVYIGDGMIFHAMNPNNA